MVIQELKVGDSVGTGGTDHQNQGTGSRVRAAGCPGVVIKAVYTEAGLLTVSRCPSREDSVYAVDLVSCIYETMKDFSVNEKEGTFL